MKINGRLLLLVVVLGLFIRVWKTNEHPRTRPAARSRSHSTQTLPSHATAPPDGATRVTTVVERRQMEDAPVDDERWTATTCPIPLPAGIAPGSYRVVSDSGRVAALTVSISETWAAVSPVPTAQPELLTTVVADERWYWIRLVREPVRSDVATTSEDASAPSIGRRKFDFSDYATPPAPAVPLIEAARPRPPELPSPL
ncbi:MAG TPA: hypothetical protein VL475_05120 [Planctomycetaceae bacterium]|jgi:hypothetical protein|nr:hypothetical protein [Planctomycetaceae bacterium]